MNELIGRYLDRATSALESADILYQNDQILALDNRTYYAIFYCVTALMHPKGYTSKSTKEPG